MEENRKKRWPIVVGILAGVLVIVAIALVIFFNSVIGGDMAEEIALADAKVSAEEVSALRSGLEFEDGRMMYEVRFYKDGREYEYVLQADDGAIASRDVEGGTMYAEAQPGGPGENPGNAPAGAPPVENETETSPSESQPPLETKITEPAPPGETKVAGEQRESAPAANAGEVTMDDAKDTALSDAGFSTSEVSFLETKRDGAVYDISFHTDTTEYDYEISASDGSIVEKSSEKWLSTRAPGGIQIETTPANPPAENPALADPAPAETTPANPAPAETAPAAPANPPAAPSTQVTLEDAKATALADAGVSAAEVTFEETYQDGRVYDISFHTSTTEYDYEISVANGSIVERSEEPWDGARANADNSGGNASGNAGGNSAGNAGNTGNFIGLERAKEIALQAAGLTAADVQFTKTEEDLYDRQPEYDIEFISGRTEYSYTIDASTGRILEQDKDIDDGD